MPANHAIFLINLLQDVSVVRPLVFMAARDLGLRTELLVSHRFVKRDRAGTWQRELAEIAQATGARILPFETEGEVLQAIAGKSGVLVAGSESNLSAHSPVNEIFRYAPSSFVKVTLQHGFECVGFLQGREHDLAHGNSVTFFADVVCGWCEGPRLSSMAGSQRPKLYVSGPPAVLQLRREPLAERPAEPIGLVCENLHSVRLNASVDSKAGFITVFNGFCEALAAEGRRVALRPHPGGQYVVKNGVSIPANVVLNNGPIYKVDLRQFAYGISPPSSIVIDMVLAGIPAAIWHAGGVVDTTNYRGLTLISSLADWLDFAREAVEHPQRFLDRQQAFLERQQMPVDPADVYGRFARLFRSAAGAIRPKAPKTKRVLFVANGYIPTLQLSFVKPLASLVEAGEIETDLLTEEEMPKGLGPDASRRWVAQRFSLVRPSLIVFCRYSGLYAKAMTAWAREQNVPVIYHIDDDLLHIPVEIGIKKYLAHNRPERLQSVRHLLGHADLVYCSTPALKERLQSFGISTPVVSGEIYCSGEVLVPAARRPARKIGYMGFDHAHDLAIVIPAIVEILDRNKDIIFELFGSIPKPPELESFGDRIVLVPPVHDYEQFMSEFAKRDWDIGICPLAMTAFNRVKASTKWVEYTAVGAAIVATRGTIYDECCADGCGILADTTDEWISSIELLINNPDARFAQVSRAQKKLTENYSLERLRDQVRHIFNSARTGAAKQQRIMFISTDYIPTLQLSFVKPLEPFIRDERMIVDYLSVQQMKERTEEEKQEKPHLAWIAERLDAFKPTLLVFCRYNGPHVEFLTEWARKQHVPTVFHIDDDLLRIPREIGYGKWKYHSRPERVSAIRHLLDHADVVYCSTSRLKERFESVGARAALVAGKIYCSGRVLVPAAHRAVRKVGYMASADHAHNLEIVITAIVEFLRRHTHVEFELFGSVPRHPALEEFGERVKTFAPVKVYDEFLAEFAKREWDIGICPLAPIPFNLTKANTKWVEYTSVGAAVIASRGTVYDECCADGCGILAGSGEQWVAALERLTQEPAERYAQVVRAQEKLQREYSIGHLREQVTQVFDQAEREVHQATPKHTGRSLAAAGDIAKDDGLI